MDVGKNFLLCLLLFFIMTCDSNKSNSYQEKPNPKGALQFGLPIKSKKVDTDQDKTMDAIGYYVADPANNRLVYQELDANSDEKSDTLIWLGLSSASGKNQPVKKPVKVHEEEDTDLDGKIDILKWMLPNDFIALTQEDHDKDGYFETTVYYNFKKQAVRSEIDTNFDGKADVILWQNRVEVDSDFDQRFDQYADTKSKLDGEARAKKKKDLQTLSKTESWFHNRKLIPPIYEVIVGR